jgi:hypothetical protein
MKIRPMEAQLFHADGQTDKTDGQTDMTETLIVVFSPRNFANRA